MPLKLVPPRQGKSPHWTIRGTYLGRYVDRSAGTPKRAIALKALARIQDDIERGQLPERGEPTFASAVAAYVNAGNVKGKTPARERENRVRLRRLVEHFGDTPLSQIDQQAIDGAATLLCGESSAATRNRSVYTPVSAILRNAGARVDLRRPRGAGGAKATAWLWPEQAEAIFAEAEKLDQTFASLLIVLCYTGMRLSEALELTWNDVRLEDGFAYVSDTKNDDPRAVFLPPVVVATLANLSKRADDRIFRFAKSGHLYHLLRAAAFRAGVDLPGRSAFHIFRHTYATWMRRYAGLDTKGLVATGAWRDRKSADRYEHVAVTEEARKAVLLPTRRGKSVA
jgi:integrase